MSNWSRLIVCWSATDAVVDPAHDVRARVILDGLRTFTSRCGLLGMTGGRGGAGELGGQMGYDGAGEIVAVYAVESFRPDEFAALLYGLAWELPVEVEFFFKDENATNYDRVLWRPNEEEVTGEFDEQEPPEAPDNGR